jgi:hypothetical protein
MSVQEAFERTLGSAPARADIIIVITANLPRGIPDRQVFDLETSFYCVRADEWLAVRGELERALGYAPESICAIKDLSNVTPDPRLLHRIAEATEYTMRARARGPSHA